MKARAYMKNPEFEARQMCFDFGVGARAVLAVAVRWRKNATEWLRQFSGVEEKKPCANRAKWLWPELIGIQTEIAY